MWALGCVIFQMLDGRPPFKAASEYLTFQKVMSRDFAMPQEAHPEAKDLIEKLLVSTVFIFTVIVYAICERQCCRRTRNACFYLNLPDYCQSKLST